MTPKFEPVLRMCIENGIRLGYKRAHKHDDNPGEDIIIEKIEDAIWNEIYEWFDFDEVDDGHTS